jgi:predicted Rossmann fold nucleotide-binding protein DprA/Smf involved in DNA uptake
LIKQGAGLVEDANDVLAEFGIDSGVVQAVEPPPELKSVFEKVLSTPTSAEQIAVELGLPVADVGIALVHLEISGFVAQRPDGYIRLLL